MTWGWLLADTIDGTLLPKLAMFDSTVLVPALGGVVSAEGGPDLMVVRAYGSTASPDPPLSVCKRSVRRAAYGPVHRAARHWTGWLARSDLRRRSSPFWHVWLQLSLRHLLR